MKLQRRGKLLLVAAGIAVVVFAIAVAFLALGDDPPIDDRDLILQRRAVAPEDNGFEDIAGLGGLEDAQINEIDALNGLLEKELDPWAGQRMAAAGEHRAPGALVPASDVVHAPGVGPPVTSSPDLAAVSSILEKHERWLAALDNSLGKRDFQFPAPASIEQSLTGLPVLNGLLELLVVRALDRLRRGDAAGALADAKRLRDQGWRIQRAQGLLMLHVVGVAWEQAAQDVLIRVVAASRQDAESIRSVRELLEDSPERIEAFRDVARAEYTLIRSDLSTREDFVEFLGAASSPFEVALLGLGARVAYKPNRTLALFAGSFRTAIHNSGVLDLRTALPEPASPDASVSNSLGTSVHALLMPDLLRFDWRGIELRRRSLLTCAALRLHLAEHGALTSSLTELVPCCLQTVPLDPFDSAPLRWDAAKRILHSVGDDLEDAGGSSAETPEAAWDDRTEPTLRLPDFGSPAR